LNAKLQITSNDQAIDIDHDTVLIFNHLKVYIDVNHVYARITSGENGFCELKVSAGVQNTACPQNVQ
jgi:hypothetical protein